MRKRIVALLGGAVLLFSCLNFLVCDLGNEPMGPSAADKANRPDIDTVTTRDSSSRNLSISVDPPVLDASNKAQADVIVLVRNDSRNPVSGAVVRFEANYGTIPDSAVTGIDGTAKVVFTAEQRNVDARISAWVKIGDSVLTISTVAAIRGVIINIIARPSAPVGATVPVTVQLLDGEGLPISQQPVRLTGTAATSGVTDGIGMFSTSATRASAGLAVITASSVLGAADTDTVVFGSGPIDTVTSARTMQIFSSKTQLRADNSDNATITVILLDDNHNPAAGEPVVFSSDLGAIYPRTVTVDSAGIARATLRSTPVNGVCNILAKAPKTNDSAATQVLFTGIRLRLVPDATELKVGEYATVEAFLKDGSENALGGGEIRFIARGGTFEDGKSELTTNLDANGRTAVKVTSTSARTVRVVASSANASDSVGIVYSLSSLSIAASKPTLRVGGKDSAQITATYVDGSSNPVAGATITFATNAGVITAATVTTGSDGKATTWLRSADFATTATVQATAPAGSAKITVAFSSASAAAVVLTVTPDNVSTNGGKATLTATVTDAQGNRVSGADVNFRILRGPGGGEYIVKPAATSQDGIATSELMAGSVPSQYRSVEVVATIGSIADTTKMTISGPPHIITVSRPEDDTVKVPNAGEMDESTFEFYNGAVVQDINGNPVADGTEVHFSAAVSGMAVGVLVLDHWAGLESVDEVKAVLRYVIRDVPFEDINNNTRMDPAIDLKLDFDDAIAARGDDANGDGIVDYSPLTHDFFYDFNGNDIPDTGVAEPFIVLAGGDTVWADLNQNGRLDLTELAVDRNGNGICDLPASGDFRFWRWEMRPFFMGERFDFDRNDFAVVIAASAVTKDGVAYARLTYPRQMARRLYVTVNAEANGIRDKDGERFVLPVIR